MNIVTISQLSRAIQEAHYTDCEYLKSARVRQIYKGRVLWQGEVSVFRLKLAAESTECYAWTVDEPFGTCEPVLILKTQAIDSPAAAVRAHVLQLSGEMATA
jgi:hypothetical protein